MPDKSLSQQPRLDQHKDIFPWIWMLWEQTDDIPAWGTPGRTRRLREIARAEPILSGALASMVSKAVSLDWEITGGRNRVARFHELLSEAEDGKGWSFLLDRWTQDYLGADLGGVLELARAGDNGPVAGLYGIDAECLMPTGNVDVPFRYFPKLSSGNLSGTSVPLLPGQFTRIVDMPSPDEARFGIGYCAVSRALKAAKVLMALYHYEDERLSDMPLPGLMTVTGMTMDEIKEAFALYQATRESNRQVVFKNLLWLAAQGSSLNPINANLVSFASLPEGFNREQVVTLYIYTLALDFGVDVREFWPASQTGATKAEAEVQAEKAKGKGFGRMLASIERALNWDVLPQGLEFKFSLKDSGDDLLRATVHEKLIGNVRRLWEPPQGAAMAAARTATGDITGGMPMGAGLLQGANAPAGDQSVVALEPTEMRDSFGDTFQGLIGTREARRLLVEAGVLPDWMSQTDEVTARGSENDTENEVPTDQGQIAQKAAQAGLKPGEDFVVMTRSGDVMTLWSPRKIFIPVPNWPGLEVPGSTRPLTSEYPRQQVQRPD